MGLDFKMNKCIRMETLSYSRCCFKRASNLHYQCIANGLTFVTLSCCGHQI